MNSLWNFFNTREQSVIIWVGFIGIWFLWSKSLRQSVSQVLKAFFRWKIVLTLIVMTIYTGLVTLLLYKLNLFEITQIKDALFWLVGTGFILLLNIDDVSKDSFYFRKIFQNSFKLFLIIEFIITSYTFSLVIELMLLPIVTILVAMQALLDKHSDFTDKKYDSVRKLFIYILSAFGLFILGLSLLRLINNYEQFISFKTFVSFIFPILLTITFLPFIYCFALYIGYEEFFIRIDIVLLKRDRILAKHIKKQTIHSCHINLKKLYRFTNQNQRLLGGLRSQEDVKSMFSAFEQSETLK